jgi:hypothetical protein
MSLKLTRFDAADYIDSVPTALWMLWDAIHEGHPGYLWVVVKAVSRAAWRGNI